MGNLQTYRSTTNRTDIDCIALSYYLLTMASSQKSRARYGKYGIEKRNLPPPPPPHHIRASWEWARYKFAINDGAKGALRHIKRTLGEIAGCEFDLLMLKASCLFHLERWDELEDLLEYNLERYPDNPGVLHDIAELHVARGQWQEALNVLKKAEHHVDPKSFNHRITLEYIYDLRITCLMALGKKALALRGAKYILKKYPRFSLVRAQLKHIQKGDYRMPKPWAPKRNSK